MVADDYDGGVGIEFGVGSGRDVAHGHEDGVGDAGGFDHLIEVELSSILSMLKRIPEQGSSLKAIDESDHGGLVVDSFT